jgi:four helix bundle protein
LRSGTSVGANVEESIGGQSKKDFLAKMFISYKEARESAYWIKLLFATDYITQTMHDSLLEDVQEILKITGKIISTARKNP